MNINNLTKSVKTLGQNLLPISVSRRIGQILRKQSWKGRNRIFCISMQRSGTTSVGDFFKFFGYPVASYNKERSQLWSKYWYEGDYDSIFLSKEFQSFQVFEDNPWFFPEFYKVLYHKFPNAKFVLMTRNSEDWFNSMMSHSDGKVLGNTRRHCKVYRREKEFYKNIDTNPDFHPSDHDIDNLMELKDYKEHYKSIYEIHNREVIDFFNRKDSNRLFYSDLYDESKWVNLGKFIGIHVPDDFEIHSNKTLKSKF